ncbi:MAG: hypothetical protein ABR927_05210 [Bacteroidales bacterium]|jgi:hypothetical protein
MNSIKKRRGILIKSAKAAIYALLAIGVIFSVKNLTLEDLIKKQIEKEKKIGDEGVNQRLYLYNAQFPIDKFIVTNYQYLGYLPDLRKYDMEYVLKDLDPASLIFNDSTVGFILWTPYNSLKLADFIETGIKSGQYKELFNYNGYRFIKIR